MANIHIQTDAIDTNRYMLFASQLGLKKFLCFHLEPGEKLSLFHDILCKKRTDTLNSTDENQNKIRQHNKINANSFV